MMESQSSRPPRDPNRVTLEDKTDLLYWTDRFSVSEARLRAGIDEVGNDVDALADLFNEPG